MNLRAELALLALRKEVQFVVGPALVAGPLSD
jgi:hypothetical protein